MDVGYKYMLFSELLSQWLVLTLFALASAYQQNERTCHLNRQSYLGNRQRIRAYLKPSVRHAAIIINAEFAHEYSIGFVDWLLGQHRNYREVGN